MPNFAENPCIPLEFTLCDRLGILSISLILPQILPQTSSQTAQGKQRVSRMESTKHPLFSLEISGNAKCWGPSVFLFVLRKTVLSPSWKPRALEVRVVGGACGTVDPVTNLFVEGGVAGAYVGEGGVDDAVGGDESGGGGGVWGGKDISPERGVDPGARSLSTPWPASSTGHSHGHGCAIEVRLSSRASKASAMVAMTASGVRR